VRGGPTNFTPSAGVSGQLSPRLRSRPAKTPTSSWAGLSTAQGPIAPDLADELRLHVRPILLGSRVRLLEGLRRVWQHFHLVRTALPSLLSRS
jgi:hypothetical protein